MPLWDYECKYCGLRQELMFSSVTHRDTQEEFGIACQCGGTMQRAPSAPAFTVKGFNAYNSYGANDNVLKPVPTTKQSEPDLK